MATLRYLSVYGVRWQDVLRCLEVPSAHGMVTMDCNNVDFSEADVGIWLNKRESVGLPLTVLDFNNCDGITSEHIEILRTMVPEVTWDGEAKDFSWPKSAVPSK